MIESIGFGQEHKGGEHTGLIMIQDFDGGASSRREDKDCPVPIKLPKLDVPVI